ncbi:hypothetical protein [Petrimonas sp.]|uniref:hypothetical protein n=1 Tax=Petrimonas sp. TaxID=2023866 RepID=UPI003F519E71
MSVSGEGSFNRELFLEKLAGFEKSWVREKSRYPSAPNDNAVEVAREMVLKYNPIILHVYREKSVF